MSIFAICRFEWTRLFFTKRGWLAIAAFVLLWFTVLRYIITPASRLMGGSEMGGILGLLLERFGLERLSNWPSTEVALYWLVALYLLPFFTLVVAADQIASDKARGTLRFLLLRCSRTQLFIGRFLGHCLIQLLLVLATLASVLLLIANYSPELLSASIEISPVLVVNLFLVLMPYVALMALVSVLARSARQATLLAVVGWIAFSLVTAFVQSRFGPFPLLDWLLPGSQISTLVRLSDWDTLQLAPIPLIHTLVLLLVGLVFFRRADL